MYALKSVFTSEKLDIWWRKGKSQNIKLEKMIDKKISNLFEELHFFNFSDTQVSVVWLQVRENPAQDYLFLIDAN